MRIMIFLALTCLQGHFSKFDEIILQGDNLILENKKNKSFGIPMIVGLKVRFLENLFFQ